MSGVEKAIEALMNARKSRDGVTLFEVEKLRLAVRAEAIASTEAKFRELADAWSDDDQEEVRGESSHQRNAVRKACASELLSLLTPCPQSRHEAGESESHEQDNHHRNPRAA